jgi:hypothetical protein
VRYKTAAAFRHALEERLRQQSLEGGKPLARLRKMVAFDRFLARLAKKQPKAWIVKGGFALQLRLGDRARTTKDIDVLAVNLWTGDQTLAQLRAAASLDLGDWSLKSANQQKQQPKRQGADFVFQFAACSTAAGLKLSIWTSGMVIPSLKRRSC